MDKGFLGILLSLSFCATPSFAVDGQNGSHWLNLDYTYTDLDYKAPGAGTGTGRLAGIRGEVGLNIMGLFGLSGGGEYQDGNLNYDGTIFGGSSIKQVTKDYFRRTEVLAHIFYGPVTIAAGLAQRYWYDDLVVSYRRRTRYDYIPIYVTYRMNSVYFRVEQDIWQKGWNKSHMHDVNASAHDVEFTLGSGNGMGAELGYLVQGGPVTTRLFIAYHKWDIKQSDTQNDGTQNLFEPKNTTTEIKVGLGLGF